MHYLTALLLLAMATAGHAQQRAFTEQGDTIYVFDNGTWSYYPEEPAVNPGLDVLSEELSIPENGVVRTGDRNKGKRLAGALGFYELVYDEDFWRRVPPATINAEAEYALIGENNGAFMITLAEEGEIGTENLLRVARSHMRTVSESPLELLEVDRRTVNGVPLIYAAHKVRISGMDIVWMAIYYSGPEGSLQVATWTVANVFPKKKAQMQALLDNVFIQQQKRG